MGAQLSQADVNAGAQPNSCIVLLVPRVGGNHALLRKRMILESYTIYQCYVPHTVWMLLLLLLISPPVNFHRRQRVRSPHMSYQTGDFSALQSHKLSLFSTLYMMFDWSAHVLLMLTYATF